MSTQQRKRKSHSRAQSVEVRTSPEAAAAAPSEPVPASLLDGAAAPFLEEGAAASDIIISKGPEAEDRPPTLPILVVGVGASAGGLEAFLDLIGHVPDGTGMAFVLVQHMLAQHRSMLASLLQPLTRMHVQEAADGMVVQPDCVYVAPPAGVLTLKGGRLHVEPRRKERPGGMIIDQFFRSLASEQRGRAIGVVLSGNDSDGALGLQAIKGEGGITIVQSESSAKCDTMPRRAIAADHVDLILPPARIGEELGRISRQLAQALAEVAEPSELPVDEPHWLARMYALVHRTVGVDFSLYKQTTLRRRIARRMVVQRIGSLAEYVQRLQENPSEVKELYEDVLINVTRFFRNPEIFAALKKDILPLLMQDRPQDQPIRIWVPGCASGEEVYSLAITLLEYLSSTGVDAPVQMFGTDLSERSIEKARTAIYPESLSSELSPEQLRRFFVRAEGGFQVIKTLRDLCVFARQNLASDPPFSRLDMISCRNVLIYLGPTLQKAIMPTFHYALKPNGVLLLGSSETIRDNSNLFVLLDKKHKFYAKNPSSTRAPLDFTGRMSSAELHAAPRLERPPHNEPWSEAELTRAAERIILARFGPAGVIINERADILQSRGHTSPFLELPSGSATLNLLRMVKEHVVMDLRDGIARAANNDVPVRLTGLRMRLDDRPKEVSVEILPIQSQGRKMRCFLVLFIPAPEPEPGGSAKQPGASAQDLMLDEKDREILQLRNDLASTKIYLQSLLEERDIANQELISANEEIQSSNEELQSINEELETAKEELQSTNEELQTVNEELHKRNQELSQTSNDLINLLSNITIPVLMLDSELRIRQYTPIAERLMNVRTTDIGRPIGEIRLNLSVHDLEPLLYDVIDTLTPKELEVQDRAGRWHLLRARPYRTAENKIEGVVLVLVDIDQIRRSQQQLVEARDFAQAVIDSAQVPLLVLTSELRIRIANRAFHELVALPADEIDGRSFPDVVARQWSMEALRGMLEGLIRDSASSAGELTFEYDTPGPEQRVLLVNARTLMVEDEHTILVAIQDITLHKQAERLLTAEKEQLEGRVKVTERALDRTQEELRGLAASLFTTQEEERRRISRELHDDLAQKVALLEINTAHLSQELTAMPSARQSLFALHQQISELSEDLRRIAFQLHPVILDDLGLAPALNALVTDLGKREAMPVRFSSRDVPALIPSTISGALYRITQEALRNIAKHAGKTQVKVSLTVFGCELRLQIRDHGNGFEPGAVRGQGGMGILNMEERTRLIGGKFTLDAKPGDGVSITVHVPLSKETP